MSIQSRLMREVPAAKSITVVATVLGLCSGLTLIWQAEALTQLIAGVFLGHSSLPEEWHHAESFLVALGVRSALIALSGIFASRQAAKAKAALRSAWMRQTLYRRKARTSDDATGDMVTAAVIGVDRLETYLSRYLPQAASAAVIPAVLWLFIVRLDWISALLLAIAAPLLVFFLILVGKGANAAAEKQWSILGQLSARLLERIEGLQILVLFHREADAAHGLRRLGEQHRRATMQTLRIAFLSSFVLELFATLGTAGVALALGLRLTSGAMIFPTAFAVLLLTPEFFTPIRALGSEFHAALDGLSAAEQLFATLDESSPAQASAPVKGRLDATADVELHDVHFRYPLRRPANSDLVEKSRDILDGVSISLPAGSKTAIVGPSGSGKSTLLSVLAGELQPVSGDIQVGREVVDSLTRAEWRSQVTLLHQHPYLFADTIANNLRIAAMEASDADLERACQAVGLTDWLKRLPDGLQTPIGDGGWPTSAGEAQRIAIARALLCNTPIWLLDEPTAHLDPITAQQIRQLLLNTFHRRTVVWVTHNQEETMTLDAVYTLENGQLSQDIGGTTERRLLS
ncbi:MAG: thiol reductant ABC exporter subunit CydD [Alicyclobacillaceae bacterium]|nr:thiol reductant ABC exporter subunit CydD [Alicyclobacillaceae bacterium]